MRSLLMAAIAVGLGLCAMEASARKTYTLEELEAMKKAGSLKGTERFVIIAADDASSLVGARKETPLLIPSGEPAMIPADAPVKASVASGVIAYDRVSPTRYLIVMAREYYGNPDFWPYIYEENKDKLGHPDRITPGTMVLVPSLSKYGVDPKKPSDVDKAKNLAREIYSRYGKEI